MCEIILALAFLISFGGAPESPRLAALSSAIKSGDPQALDKFWQDVKGRAPLIEAMPGNDNLQLVTFLWRGGAESRGICLLGPFTADIREKPLVRLAKTDVWFLTVRFPKEARFSYAFRLAEKAFPDPLNGLPVTALGTSLAELPAAPPQPWIKFQADVPKGILRHDKIFSNILGEERKISIYTPPGHQPHAQPYGLLVIFDAEDYRTVIPTPTILDNLISSRKIPPLVAIMIDSVNQNMRSRDLSCSDLFSDFLAKELVPWARQNYSATTNPDRTILCGVSLGGLAAAYSALRHPEVFGNVLSQSGAFWYYPDWRKSALSTTKMGWLRRQFESIGKLPIRFYLECGSFENDSDRPRLKETQRLRDVLMSKGYNVTFSEFVGGHDYLCWRGSVADGLIALAGN